MLQPFHYAERVYQNLMFFIDGRDGELLESRLRIEVRPQLCPILNPCSEEQRGRAAWNPRSLS